MRLNHANHGAQPIPAWLVDPPRASAVTQPPVVLGRAPGASRGIRGQAEAGRAPSSPPRPLLRGMRSTMGPRGPYVRPCLGLSLPWEESSKRWNRPTAAGPMAHRGPPRSGRTPPASGRELRGRSASHRGPRPTSVRAARAARAAVSRDDRAAAIERSAHDANRRGHFHLGEPRLPSASRQVPWPSMTPPIWLDATGRPCSTRACWT